jgi:hypothetical protein
VVATIVNGETVRHEITRTDQSVASPVLHRGFITPTALSHWAFSDANGKAAHRQAIRTGRPRAIK